MPHSFSPQFFQVVIYMDQDKKVMVLVNTVVCVYMSEIQREGKTGELKQVSDIKEKG